jgi:hypothetical protein
VDSIETVHSQPTTTITTTKIRSERVQPPLKHSRQMMNNKAKRKHKQMKWFLTRASLILSCHSCSRMHSRHIVHCRGRATKALSSPALEHNITPQ